MNAYYNVGNILVEAQGGENRSKYGNNLIKNYSTKLSREMGIGYNTTSLKRMRQFFLIIEKGATLSHQLTWSHYIEIIKLSEIEKVNYYINQVMIYNLSIRELRRKIEKKEYERIDNATKLKLSSNLENKIEDFIKNPILIKNGYDCKEMSEKLLKQLILEDLDNFLAELGDGFTYVKNEYKIKLGVIYNYIDLLLYNIKYNCYVVIELKITELKAEHIGQISKYMNYMDKCIKGVDQEKTIGIIICKKNNQFVMEYCSDDRIFSKEYNIEYSK